MVFVRNLTSDVTDDSLKSMFSPVGTVSSLKIDKGPLTNAFVGFVEVDSAQKAVDKFHKMELNGRTIKVSLSDTGNNKSKNTNTRGHRVSIFDKMR